MTTSPIQILRTGTPGARPVSHSYGSPYVNHQDAQFGVVDSNGNAFDLLAVRVWSAAASYAIGDFVTTNGFLYRAVVPSVPGPFIAANWSQMQSAANVGGAYLPLTGGTLTGGLTVQSSTTLTGPAGMFAAHDRGNGGGTTTSMVGLYRDANLGRLWMSEVGDCLQVNTAGNVTVPRALVVSGQSYLYGACTVYKPATHSPFVVQTDPGYNSAMEFVGGWDTWVCGPDSGNNFYILDASTGQANFYATPGQTSLPGNVFACQGANTQLTLGVQGHFDAGTALTLSPSPSGNGSGGGAMSYVWAPSQGCYWARTDNWQAYIMYFLYGTSANPGSITTNGTNTFYNTSCDERLKDNIRPLHEEIDVGGLIDSLKPVAFEWKPINEKVMIQTGQLDPMELRKNPNAKAPEPIERDISLPARTDHGFVAQDLFEVLPDIVHRPQDGERSTTWSADYSKLIPYLVAEIQNLRARLAAVEGK